MKILKTKADYYMQQTTCARHERYIVGNNGFCFVVFDIAGHCCNLYLYEACRDYHGVGVAP